MNLDVWLQGATHRLESVSIPTARLDVLVLLEDCLDKDRAQLLAHPEMELSAEQQKRLDAWVSRRVLHEPLAYIRQKTEFYGREFYVDHRVLEPRPESETIIDLLKELVIPALEPESRQKSRVFLDPGSSLPNGKAVRDDTMIVDIGTGSGMLAVTAKLEIPEAQVLATDIDPKCLEVAKLNDEAYETDITFLLGDLVNPLMRARSENQEVRTKNLLLLCNLPYVPDTFKINLAAGHEPRQAIFGGPDGLDLYRVLFEQIDSLEAKPSHILTESLPPQHEQLATIATSHGYKQLKENDFIQVFVAT